MGRLTLCLLLVVLTTATGAVAQTDGQPRAVQGATMASDLPTIHEAIMSKRDLWGEAAMEQPNGPSYEFFEPLLPPLRYVRASFRHYPIMLSAPGSPVKARLVADGSGVNSLAESIVWREVGFPVTVRVGEREALFGAHLEHLDGPHYEQGYLPVVTLRYRDADQAYELQAFAGVEPTHAAHGAVFVRFRLVEGTSGVVTLSCRAKGAVRLADSVLRDAEGRALVWTEGGWTWQPAWKLLSAPLSTDRPLCVVIFTRPLDPAPAAPLAAAAYEQERERCTETWEALLARGMRVETPEPVVNNAWKSLLIGSFALLHEDEMRYSAGNQYAKLYIGEGGDATRAMLLWGFRDEARRMIVPLFDYTRKGLEIHQAAKKLQMLAHYFWLTRDADFLRLERERWAKEVAVLVDGRETGSGLYPREKYCGDLEDRVHSLNSAANAWRALHDMAAVLAEVGENEEASRLVRAATELRPAILAAVERSERRDVTPPFTPIALFGEEEPYDVLTATKAGSYYDLMIPYVMESGVFGLNSERETWMVDYLREHGGLCMGMIRCRPTGEHWVSKSNVNDLYGLRYTLTLLRRDEVDAALVSFYGKLAQGLTRDTFIGGEASCLVPADESGRQFYLPPNSAGNAFFLWMLRYMLVQDWDLDEDGKPDALRLMFATPRRWLQAGKSVRVEGAPTAFGPVSVSLDSRLRGGEILARVQAPPIAPGQTLLRARVPEGWRVTSADVAGTRLPADKRGTIDVSGFQGDFTVRMAVRRDRA